MNKHHPKLRSFYSIRKSTLGVASVIVSTLFLITSQHQAQAAENTNTQIKSRKIKIIMQQQLSHQRIQIKHNLLRNQQTLRKPILQRMNHLKMQLKILH